MKSILSLPVPILVKIFSCLSVTDKKKMSLMCSFLAKVISDPILWTLAPVNKLRMTSGEDQEDIKDNLMMFFSLPRYTLLFTLDLSNMKNHFIDKTVVIQFLKYLQQNTNLGKLIMTNTDMSKISAFPLSTSLIHTVSLELSNTKLKTEQLNCILVKCCRGRFTKHVDLSFNDFSYVNADLLADSISTLTSLNLSYTDLTPMYTRRIMESVKNSSIQVLNLSGNDLSSCKFDNIGLNQNLTSLRLSEVKLNPDNLDKIFSNLTFVHNLQELILDGTAIGDVDPILLGDAIVRIHKVDLNFCWLYCEHIEFILDGINEKSKLKHLNLSGNHFENVNVDLLVNSLYHLDTCRIEWANLTEEHFEAIITDTGDLKEHNTIILNHFELLENNLDLHRQAKLHPNIKLNMVKG